MSPCDILKQDEGMAETLKSRLLHAPHVRSGCASRPTTRPVRVLAATPPSGPATVASSSLDFQPGACERSSTERAQYLWKARERAKSCFVMRCRTLCSVTSQHGGSRACSPSEHKAPHLNCVRKQASLRRSDKLGSGPHLLEELLGRCGHGCLTHVLPPLRA